MSEESKAMHPSGPSHRSVEIGVAVGLIVFALIIIAGSLLVGVGWASVGPRAGFFPFYCGLFVLVASCINLYNAIVEPGGGLFAEWGQLGQVVSVVIPGGLYVALVPSLGMYVASAILIAVFMKWIGKYGWLMVAVIPVPVMMATFLIFEKWFLVPLPKGPLEEFLGY